MILLFAGKLSQLHSNSKHLIIERKKFAGKPSRLEAKLRKPRKFSTANDLHYTVFGWYSHSCHRELQVEFTDAPYLVGKVACVINGLSVPHITRCIAM